eukprot:3894872-Alexandrium_andersonii.AAC.1
MAGAVARPPKHEARWGHDARAWACGMMVGAVGVGTHTHACTSRGRVRHAHMQYAHLRGWAQR